MSNIKDTLTTILAVIMVIATAVTAYLNGVEPGGSIDIFQLLVGVVAAIIAWFTGRNGDGSKKNTPSKV